MSTTVMSFCWPIDWLSPAQKSVLIALADAANDDGICWIAVRSRREAKLDLIVKTCLSERAVQDAIKALVGLNLLERNEKPGQGCWYIVTPPGFIAGYPPEWLIKRQKNTPARSAGATPAAAAQTPAGGAGKPSLTRKTSGAKAPSSSRAPKVEKRNTAPDDWEPKEAHLEKARAFGWPDGMLEEQAERFREWEFREPKTDFDRAFHRWLRTENDRLKGRSDEPAGTHLGGIAPRGRPTERGERIAAMQHGAMEALERRRRRRQ